MWSFMQMTKEDKTENIDDVSNDLLAYNDDDMQWLSQSSRTQ